MTKAVDIVSTNIKHLREAKALSQKEVAAVFEVSLSRFFNAPADTEEINLPLMEKVRLMDALPKEEKSALFKIIDLALANKRMKDNIQAMIAH